MVSMSRILLRPEPSRGKTTMRKTSTSGVSYFTRTKSASSQMPILRHLKGQLRYVSQTINVVIHGLTVERYKISNSRQVVVATADSENPIPTLYLPHVSKRII